MPIITLGASSAHAPPDSRTSASLASFQRCSESSRTPSRSKITASGIARGCRRRRLGTRTTHGRARSCRSEVHMDAFRDWALEWQGVFSLIFMLVIAGFLWRTIRLMPRTKPQQIKPDVKHAIGWGDIAGVDEAKDELREVVEFLRDPGAFKKVGASVPKGILLHGPPGTGKTLLAKAVAHESGAQFFSQSAASFVEMFVGLGAARIRRLFKEARENAPAIVFIDELDAVGAHRGSDISGERDQTLNQLLVEMDGFDSRDNVVVMAASNLLEKLDKALLRPGRFDRQVFVPPPDMRGRERILEVHTRGKPLA